MSDSGKIEHALHEYTREIEDPAIAGVMAHAFRAGACAMAELFAAGHLVERRPYRCPVTGVDCVRNCAPTRCVIAKTT